MGVAEKIVLFYSGPVGDVLGRSRNGEVSNEVGTDLPASERRVVVTRCLNPLACDEGRPASSSVPVVQRSSELLELASDTGMAVSRCVSI